MWSAFSAFNSRNYSFPETIAESTVRLNRPRASSSLSQSRPTELLKLLANSWRAGYSWVSIPSHVKVTKLWRVPAKKRLKTALEPQEVVLGGGRQREETQRVASKLPGWRQSQFICRWLSLMGEIE